MGLDDKIKGAAQDAKGKIKEKVGDATDDHSMHAEGLKDQAVGETRKKVGEVKDEFNK